MAFASFNPDVEHELWKLLSSNTWSVVDSSQLVRQDGLVISVSFRMPGVYRPSTSLTLDTAFVEIQSKLDAAKKELDVLKRLLAVVIKDSDCESIVASAKDIDAADASKIRFANVDGYAVITLKE